MTTSFDQHKNLAYSAVATAPSPATTGTSLALSTGGGALMPTPPFNLTIWPGGGATASQSNAEIVRVTAISTDTLTIIRAQEGSTAQSIGVGYQVALTGTAKTLTDIENAINATLGGVLTGTLPSPGLAAGSVGVSQIASGAVGTSQLAAGAVGTAQLAAGAVTQRAQAVASTSSPTTTSASLVALPDMSVALTTTGGDLFAILVATVSNTTAGVAISLAIGLDGGAAVSTEVASIPGVSGAVCITVAWMFTGVAAGAHTVAGQWSTSSGTATANGVERSLQVVEYRR